MVKRLQKQMRQSILYLAGWMMTDLERNQAACSLALQVGLTGHLPGHLGHCWEVAAAAVAAAACPVPGSENPVPASALQHQTAESSAEQEAGTMSCLHLLYRTLT